MDKKAFVSIIIPCRNEELYISKVLDNIINQDFDKSYLEVIIVDGNSEDKTASIIMDYATKYSYIKCLKNPNLTVPYALNQAISESNGDVIIRMDAHAIYPSNYISKLTKQLFQLGADNIGGIIKTLPNNESLIAHSIAIAMSSSFGVGNSYFRIGTNKPKSVDTVPFGCFRREIFNKIGLFDTELTRNQDDEFNGRIIQNGGKIFLIPDVEIKYYARSTWKKMSLMFYQYGLFKPLVNRKLKKPATIRQFFPLGFVMLLFWIVITPLIWMPAFLLGLIALSLYFVLNFSTTFMIVRKAKNVMLLFTLPITFFLIHTSYGWGYLIGIVRFQLFRKKVSQIGLSR